MPDESGQSLHALIIVGVVSVLATVIASVARQRRQAGTPQPTAASGPGSILDLTPGR